MFEWVSFFENIFIRLNDLAKRLIKIAPAAIKCNIDEAA